MMRVLGHTSSFSLSLITTAGKLRHLYDATKFPAV